MQFKDLAIGQQFIFESEQTMPFSGMAKGPWIKLSARSYDYADNRNREKEKEYARIYNIPNYKIASCKAHGEATVILVETE